MSPKFFGIFRCSPCARTTSYPACLASFSPSGMYKRITDWRGTIARSPPTTAYHLQKYRRRWRFIAAHFLTRKY
jgi:hypothetical protein